MARNILLVEPGYKTKFPPLGLMKISSYHKELGDNVRFVKGMKEDLAYEETWDRIYISTLFTYDWKVTVDTVKYYKEFVHGDPKRIVVGGILASLMRDELWKETGVPPIKHNILNVPGVLGDDNDLIVDEMIPDYDLFKGSPQQYSLIDDNYFGYITRGCIHKCDFCGVPRLEPNFVDYRDIKPYVRGIAKKYGEKAHLTLFDNNVLASSKFNKIVKDIIGLGFEKGAKYSYISKAGTVIKKARYVDFNQGIDARLLNEEKIKLLSMIAIDPLRVAFDHINLKNQYKECVELAIHYGIHKLSNYILYNHKDTPEDFWERLHINIEINSRYSKDGIKIYSFPMKYIPLNNKNRSYIDPNWNWYFIRSVQRILNVVKGVVMPGEDFFYRAFGHSAEEFKRILYMPEKILMYRDRIPKADEINWISQFDALTVNEKADLLSIINNNTRAKLFEAVRRTNNYKLKRILDYYLPDQSSNDHETLWGDTSD